MAKIKGFRISVDAGHCAKGADTSAVGIGYEYKMNVEVKNLVIQKLRALGAIVQDCSIASSSSMDQSLAGRVAISNKFGAKLHICIHHNSFATPDGEGAEVLYVSPSGKLFAEAIQEEFVKLGFKNRGAKCDKELYVLNHTNAVAVLTEGCFISSPKDMKRYSAEKEATAIVNGVLKTISK